MSNNKIAPDGEIADDTDLAINLKAIRVATESIAKKAKLVTGISSRKAEIENIVNGVNPGMFYTDFDFWYNIIKNDDVKGAKEIMESLGEQERMILMNAPFLFNDLDCVEHDIDAKEREKIVLFCKPTSIAVVHRSRNILSYLTENGVHFKSRDVGANNVFHVMATVSHSFPEYEDIYAEMYEDLVQQIGDMTIVKYILHQENNDGYRPLELATIYDVHALVIAILETEGIYKFTSYGMTPMPLVRYDLTEYENWSNDGRRMKSPLRYLVYLTQLNMKKDSCDNLFHNPVMEKWISAKFRGYLPFIILWFLLRTIFLASFVDSGIEKHIFLKKEGLLNQTCPAKVPAIKAILSQGTRTSDSGFSTYYFIIYAFAVLFVDVVEIVALFTFRKTPKRPTALRFWTRCSFTFYCRTAVAFACIVGLMDIFMINFGFEYLPTEIARQLTTMGTSVYIFGVMALVWSHLFFLQLIPKIGHFLIGFQWMLLAFCSFVVVFFYIFGTLSIAFNKLYLLSCIDGGFGDFFNSLYSTFLVMLNMKTFEIVEADVAILHAVFVFIIALLLLNFLIAILTDTQATVTKHIVTIESIQRLDMVLALEDRFGWLYNKVWNRQSHFVFTLKRNLIRK